jgi:hypothetical protein
MTAEQIILEKTKKGVVWTDPEGKRHDYEREAIRTLELRVLDLQICTGTVTYSNSDPIDVPFGTHIRGKACLADRSIEIIGAPGTRDSKMVIDFGALTDDRKAWVFEKADEGIIRQAALGYIKANWEIGNDSEWFVSLFIPSSQMDELLDAILNNRIANMTACISSPDLYVDDPYAPPSAKIGWFVCPDEYGSAMISGRVHSINYNSVTLDLRPTAPSEPDSTEEQDEYFKPATEQDKVVPAIDRLTEKVGKLTTYIGWLVFIVFVIGFMLGARH